MRDQWNTALHGPLQQEFYESRTTALLDVLCIEYLRGRGITTLLFSGVNTDHSVFASLQDACNMGFDTILLENGCSTNSPEYATKLVKFSCRKSWGFVSSCQGLENGVGSMGEVEEAAQRTPGTLVPKTNGLWPAGINVASRFLEADSAAITSKSTLPIARIKLIKVVTPMSFYGET